MNWQAVELANGLRLVTIRRPQSQTVAVEVLVRAGSRYDRAGSGGAHLLEHLLFRGTRSRTAREVYTTIERFGGSIEGHTAKEYVRFEAVLPSRHFGVGVEILAETLTAPRLAEEDFWSEKLLVLEESQRMRDSINFIFHLFAQAIWPQHPLGQPVWGEARQLAGLGYAELVEFYAQAYVAGNAIVVLCGDVAHGAARDTVERWFAALPAGGKQALQAVEPQVPAEPCLVHLEKDLLQTHLLLGFPTVGLKHGDQGALTVIERVLGMGGSARLFQLLREKEKLVYNVFTVLGNYEDAGYLAAYATCRPQNVARVRALLLREFEKLGQSGITDEELVRARSNYEGTLARRFETNSAVASALGAQTLLHRLEPLHERLARIRAVTREDVVRAARQYLTPERTVQATVGQATQATVGQATQDTPHGAGCRAATPISGHLC